MTERLATEIQKRGNFAYTLADMVPRNQGRAPLAVASFIAIPLFFSSLMASALALEKPYTIEWKGCAAGICTTWHEPTTRNIVSIWLWALVPPLILIVVGLIATRLPFGFYVSCLAAIVLATAVVHKTATWERHHTLRYPVGVDLIPPSNPASDKYDRGQWEAQAKATAISLGHWTIGLAVISGGVMAGLTIRRRYFVRKPVQAYLPLEGVHGADATLPGLGDPNS